MSVSWIILPVSSSLPLGAIHLPLNMSGLYSLYQQLTHTFLYGILSFRFFSLLPTILTCLPLHLDHAYAHCCLPGLPVTYLIFNNLPVSCPALALSQLPCVSPRCPQLDLTSMPALCLGCLPPPPLGSTLFDLSSLLPSFLQCLCCTWI